MLTARTARSLYPLASPRMPARYSSYERPHCYGNPGGSRARLLIEVLSGVAADFDALFFTLSAPLEIAPGAVAMQGYTFDDDIAPPTTTAAIKISGLATAAAIADQLALGLSLQTIGGAIRLRVTQPTTTTILVEQLYRGAAGNTPVFIAADLDDLLRINGGSDFGVRQPYFYGGADFMAPSRLAGGAIVLPSSSVSPRSVAV